MPNIVFACSTLGLLYVVQSTPVCYATDQAVFIAEIRRLEPVRPGIQLLGRRKTASVSQKPFSMMSAGNPKAPGWCLRSFWYFPLLRCFIFFGLAWVIFVG